MKTVALSLFAMASTVHAGSCKPVTLLMTRASGSEATYENGTWSTEYGLSSVNTGSVASSLKYIMTETIDKNAGYAECERKNGVAYIHFYQFTICNPDEALWWFNYREGGYGGDPAKYNYGEFGQYLTFDLGKCHGTDFCNYLGGNTSTPKLGPYVGWQDVSDDDRNPTDKAYWYSLPGECPMYGWGDKSDECVASNPSGRCEDGVTPDGEACSWSYTLLGQVSLDDLSGITDIDDPATGAKYINATTYCQAGNVEFERDSTTFEFIQGLPFWEDPLNRTRNALRIDALIAKYATYPNNLPLPNVADLNNNNPRCYESVPGCYDAATKTETCTRNDQSHCVPCAEVEGGCAAIEGDGSAAFQSPNQVELPSGNTDTDAGNTDTYDESDATKIVSSLLVAVTALMVLLA